jgi:hypothetical protein
LGKSLSGVETPYILSVIVICIAGEPYRRDHYAMQGIEHHGEVRYIDTLPIVAGSDLARGHHKDSE